MTDTSECDSHTTEQSSGSSNNRDTNLQILCKQMLKTRVFLGQYQEKRFVDAVKNYRDLIVINHTETEVIRDFEAVQSRVLREYGGTQQVVWFGFTGAPMIGAPSGSCVWTELSESIPFGEYWFQVKTVRFRSNEVVIKLKVLRAMHQSDQRKQKTISRQPVMPETADTNNISNTQIVEDFSDLLAVWRRSLHDSLLWLLSQKMTAQNVMQFFKFIALLLVAALTGSLYAIKFLGLFTLRFMEEFSKLMHVMMPFLLRCLDLINKAIGGFYILIAMVWRDSIGGGRASQRHPPHHNEAIMPNYGEQDEQPARYGSFSNNMGRERRTGQSTINNPGRFRR